MKTSALPVGMATTATDSWMLIGALLAAQAIVLSIETGLGVPTQALQVEA